MDTATERVPARNEGSSPRRNAARQAARSERSPWRARLIGGGAVLALVVAIAASTTYRDADAPVEGAPVAFDPAAYGRDNYAPKVVPAIEEKAVPLTELATAIAADPQAAGEQFGERSGASSPWSYAVSFTGTAGAVQGSLMQITVPGVGGRVSVQVGPAVNGTALRDAVGFIQFGQFLNQVEYADAGTALNNEMKAAVLASLDPASLSGKQVTVTGATTVLTPDVITVTPVSLEAAP